MDVPGRIKRMQALDLFQDLSGADHREFIDELDELQLAPGDILFQDGDPAESLYVLVEGALEVTKNMRPITLVEPVDYIGEMALLEDLPRSATVTAVRSSGLLAVSRSLFERHLHGHPRLPAFHYQKPVSQDQQGYREDCPGLRKGQYPAHGMRKKTGCLNGNND